LSCVNVKILLTSLQSDNSKRKIEVLVADNRDLRPAISPNCQQINRLSIEIPIAHRTIPSSLFMIDGRESVNHAAATSCRLANRPRAQIGSDRLNEDFVASLPTPLLIPGNQYSWQMSPVVKTCNVEI
jgi:hypothetical protein